jgi:leucyl/phenylalanyl-tRNA--protein transferase
VSQGSNFPPMSKWGQDGLVAAGGPLTPQRVVEAYRLGIFPWPVDESPAGLLWWSPQPRAVLVPNTLHVPRRLARTLRTGGFDVTTDTDFPRVLELCGSVGDRQYGTWITPQIADAYCQLHSRGVAHSVEVRRGGRLVGGLYGICMGGMFAGESMFSLERDASKVALVWLVRRLAEKGCLFFDVQIASQHLTQFGVQEIERSAFCDLLAAALKLPSCWTG